MHDDVDRVTAALTVALVHPPSFYRSVIALQLADVAPSRDRERAWAVGVGEALTRLRETLGRRGAVPAHFWIARAPQAAGPFDRHAAELAAEHGRLQALLERSAALLDGEVDQAGVATAHEAVTALLVQLFRQRQRGLDLVAEHAAAVAGAADGAVGDGTVGDAAAVAGDAAAVGAAAASAAAVVELRLSA
jgi:hypothetical protein